MGRSLGVALILIALFMLVGFLRADLAASGVAQAIAFVVAVVLPAVGGVALLAAPMGSKRRVAARRQQLRRQTLDAEVLRLAGRRGGKLTVVEVVTELAVTTEEATESLDQLARHELAELEVTESGTIVYAFRDVQNLAQKDRAKGILDG